MNDKEFAGPMGENYELLRLAWPYYDELRSVLAQFIKKFFANSNSRGILVLEIGCGTGDATKKVLEGDGRIKVIAVDNEPILLNKAKSLLKDYLLQNRLQLINEDALNYLKKSKPEYFDAVASSLTLHNFNKNYRHEALKEILRTLKKGGLFISADKYVPDNEREDRELFNLQIKKFDLFDSMGKLGLKKELIEHESKDRSPEFIMKEKESTKEMQSLGFKDIKTLHREKREAVISGKK